MKRICMIFGLIFVVVIFLTSCNSLQSNLKVDFQDGQLSVLQESALSICSYLIVKNNPTYLPEMLEWYNTYKQLSDLSAIQFEFETGYDKLAKMVSNDPFLQIQIKNAIQMLNINIKGPQTSVEITKYRAIIDAFMSGITPMLITAEPLQWDVE